MQKCSEYLLSDAGAPVANAQITVYYFGTSTLAPLFATATGVVIANPIASLSNGYFEFYAADGKYTLAIAASGFSARTVTAEIFSDQNTIAKKQVIAIACSDETTPVTVGQAKVTFRMPFAFTLTGISASLTTAPTGAALIADVKTSGSTLMTSNKLRIDSGTKSTFAAATQPTLSITELAIDDEITIDITQVGATAAGAGLKVYLVGIPT